MTPAPAAIEKKMKLWRNGLTGFPQEFIEWHAGLATEALAGLKAKGFVVHNSFMASDGWGDGMKALTVIAEYQDKLMKLQWHAGNQEFFVQMPSAGSSPLRFEAPAVQ